MQAETLMLYKLIVLYILDKVDFPLTNGQLTNFILEKEYTSYFNIQQAISELIEDNYISSETIRNSSLYQITDSGRETLSFFSHSISQAIRDDIDIYLKEHKYSLRNEVSTLADYFESKKDEYVARLRVVEGESTVIELILSVPTEREANIICNNWRDKSADIYAYVISSLIAE
jgi:DNA-binding PadR family transcriptional regulator